MDDHPYDVKKALELIEHGAQASLLEAARQICWAPAMANEYFATLKLYDRVKAHWHRVEQKRAALARKEAAKKHR